MSDEEIEEIRREVKQERHRIDPHMWVHSPNRIPVATRLKYLVLSTALIAYGCFGLWAGTIYFPGKRGPGVYFVGMTMWILFAAMLAAAVNMISVIVDHYDQRNNEATYKTVASYSFWVGCCLLVATFVIGFVNNDFR